MDGTPTLEDFRKDETLFFDFLEYFFKYKPRNYQKKFLLACLKNKRIAGKWCRQSGKSYSLAHYDLFRCVIAPTTIIITAPTLTHSTELYMKIRALVEGNELIKNEIEKLTATEMIFKNGSRIKALPTGTEGKSIRGFTADVVNLEEAGLVKDEIVNSVITPLIASKKDEGQIIKIGTPLTKNHFYRSCFLDDTYTVINVRWEDCVKENQYTIDFINEQKKNLTDIEFRTEYDAEFIEEMASFFPSKLIDSCMEDFNFIKFI